MKNTFPILKLNTKTLSMNPISLLTNKLCSFSLSVTIAVLLSACANTSNDKFTPAKSFLEKNKMSQLSNTKDDHEVVQDLDEQEKKAQGMQYISSLSTAEINIKKTVDLTKRFSSTKQVEITSDELPLKDYLHYVMGDLLGVSYILGDKVKSDKQAITLNLQQQVTQRKLFSVSESLLNERGYVIRFDDGIYYIHSSESSAKGTVIYGYGNDVANVPNSSQDIMQMVPFTFGIQMQLSIVLSGIAKVKVVPMSAQNAFLIRGKRREIIKALDFINLMDQPAFRDRAIGLYKTTFVSTDEIRTKLAELLKQEGLNVSAENRTDKAISIISLDRSGSLVFFAPDQKILQRVNFWLRQIDQPISGDVLQYFLYHPQFSRATDLGDSLQVLIGGGVSSGISSRTSAAGQNNNVNQDKVGGTRAQTNSPMAANENMKMVVDQRANALIFHTTGEQYQQLIPLIKQLDVMPKQIILEVIIAEVTLTDEFKEGVEFALNKGSYGLSTDGAFMGTGFGGLSYLLSGTDGQVAINLLQTNSLVNILSRPSIVVRDGVNANINVGTDIPLIGETTNDPLGSDKQSTTIVYRKTGVELDVLPTINAQGVILMEIKQKISNEVDAGSTTVISPSVFERSITTEVVAESGQTILLGGLMSENITNKETKVPLFGDLPLIGALFKGKTKSGDKTELVVLVTPRIIESSNEWEEIKNKFIGALTELSIK